MCKNTAATPLLHLTQVLEIDLSCVCVYACVHVMHLNDTWCGLCPLFFISPLFCPSDSSFPWRTDLLFNHHCQHTHTSNKFLNLMIVFLGGRVGVVCEPVGSSHTAPGCCFTEIPSVIWCTASTSVRLAWLVSLTSARETRSSPLY